ncbi:insulinase family protein [bacterium]|nr:insulinase family protein [bacterium]
MQLSFFSKFLGVLVFLSFGMVSQANALEVLTERDSRVPLAYINVVLRTGSVADPIGKAGITNFMGDMLLRGTQRHTKEEIDLLLDQWGAMLGVETRTESVVIRGAVLSSNLKAFLDLTQEIMTQPTFPQSEIDKVKKETLSGLLAQQGNDNSLAGRKFGQFMFPGHAYGRPIDGTASEVSKFDRDLLFQQHRRIFRKELILVLGVGDIDRRLMESWANRLVSDLPKSTAEPLPAASKPEFSAPRRLQIVDKPNRTQTQILIGQVGTLMTDPDYYALYLGNVAFGGGSFTSRLMQEIRVKRGWSYGASSAFRFGLQPRSWRVHLFPAEKDTAAALTTSLQLIESLKKDGITEKEFQSAKQSSINSAAFINDTPKKRIENRIVEETLGLPEGFFAGLADNLKKISREDVNRALAKFLTPEKLTITVVGTAERLKKDLANAVGIPADRVVVTPYTAD